MTPLARSVRFACYLLLLGSFVQFFVAANVGVQPGLNPPAAPNLIAGAQTDSGEEPPPISNEMPVRERAALTLTIREMVVTAGLGEKITLPVQIQNRGNATAQNVVVTVDGSPDFSALPEAVGAIAPGKIKTVVLSIQVDGRYLGANHILITATADNLVNPAQGTATLIYPSDLAGVTDRFLLPGSGPVSTNIVQVISERRLTDIPTSLPLLHFRLTNLPVAEATPTAEIALDDLLNAAADATAAITVIFTGENDTESQEINAALDTSTNQLSLPAIADGEYVVLAKPTAVPPGALAGTSSTPTGPDDPSSWSPSFNDPVVSIFQGSATYNYPIESPPGPGGFQPALSLAFNGSGSNGVMGKALSNLAGWGWNLAGQIEISQAVILCDWDTGKLCPVNAYWGSDNKAWAGDLEFTLSIGGAGYDLIHKSGKSMNGYPGKYFVEGNAGVYVEYCHHPLTNSEPPSDLCLMHDDDDSGSDGMAEQASGGFWVVKTADNSAYRLGYAADSEQELVGVEDGSGGRMGPWSSSLTALGYDYSGPYALALRWQVDKAQNRFGNAIAYAYQEYWPSQVNGSWQDNHVHAPANYLSQIDYGFNRITLTYGPVTAYGAPPVNTPDSVSWQTHRLQTITVKAQDYANPTGAYATVRSYELTHVFQRHGTRWHEQPQVNPSGANQTDWCANWTYDNLTGWKVSLLTTITEKDKNGNPLTNSPNVEFDYRFRRTGSINFSGVGEYRYCYPYVESVYTFNGPLNGDPTVSFTYYPEGWWKYDLQENNYISVVSSKRVRSGWDSDAPVMKTVYHPINSPFYDVDEDDTLMESVG